MAQLTPAGSPRNDSPDHGSPDQRKFSDSLWYVIGVVALSAVGFFLYFRSLDYDMIFDDRLSILENDSIQELWPLFGGEKGYGPLNPMTNTPLTARPVVSLAFAINYHFGGENPYGYRLAHLMMHLAAAFLLWAIVAITLGKPRFSDRFLRYRHPLAIGSAMVWLVHPCHTETIIYLTQRTELMMGFFYLLTLYCSIQYWESRSLLIRFVWCILATVACLAGMMCKEMMASVPAMVFLYEWTFITGTLRERWKQSWPLYLGLSLGWILIGAIYQAGYNTPLAGFNNIISAVDWWMTQSNAFFVYWRLTFFPWPLQLHYQVPTLTNLHQAWPGVLGIAIYAISAAWLSWRRHPLGFVMVWYFAVLSPTLIVPLPTEEIAERRLYVSLAAVAPLFVVGCFVLCLRIGGSRFWNRWAESITSSSDTKIRGSFLCSQLATLGVIVVFSFLCVTTMPRLSDRKTIWTEVLKYEPDNAFAIFNQGCVEYNLGNREAGLKKMWIGFDAKRGYKYGVITLARALEDNGQQEKLVGIYRKAIVANPMESAFQYNLAFWLENDGMREEAIEHYREAIRMDPLFDAAHTNLALVLAERGDVALAIDHMEAAVETKPDLNNCMNLMNIYLQTQQFKMATIAARKMLDAARREGNHEVAEQIQRNLEALEKYKP